MPRPLHEVFGRHSPMQALAVDKLPAAGNWLYEVKPDGYRALALCRAGAKKNPVPEQKGNRQGRHEVATPIAAVNLQYAFIDKKSPFKAALHGVITGSKV